MLREWAYVIPFPSSHRGGAVDLPRWLASITTTGPLLDSHDDSRLKHSPEQPDQNSQLGPLRQVQLVEQDFSATPGFNPKFNR